MTEQDKQRLEEQAQEYLNNLDEALSGDEIYFVRMAYIAAATAEHERMLDEINTEKHLVNVYKMQANTAHGVIKELLRAISFGEMELREMYVRHTPYKGSTYLWIMQEMLEKYKSFLDKGKSQ